MLMDFTVPLKIQSLLDTNIAFHMNAVLSGMSCKAVKVKMIVWLMWGCAVDRYGTRSDRGCARGTL